MPVTESNYSDALDLLEKSKADPRTSPEKLQALRDAVGAYEDSLPEPEAPKQEPAAPGHVPGMRDYQASKAVEGTPQSLGFKSDSPTSPNAYGGFGNTDYFYEPSLDEARQQIQKPEVARQLGLQPYQTSADSLSGLDESSDAYQRYAEARWRAEAARAQSAGVTLNRYKDLSLRQNPFLTALGGVEKYLPSALHGASQGALFGLPEKAAEMAVPGLKGVGEELPQSTAANAVGQVAGAVYNPVVNPVAKGLTKALGYAAAGPLARLGISGAVGAAGSELAGAGSDVVENLDQEHPLQAAAAQVAQNALPRAAFGAVGGAGFDALSQAAGGLSRAIAEAPRYEGLKAIRDAGGDTDVVRGIRVPPRVKQYVSQAVQAGGVGKAPDLAAEQVAPAIQASLEEQAAQELNRFHNIREQFLESPEGKTPRSMKPVMDTILGMFGAQGHEGPVTGELMHANPEAANTLKRALFGMGQVAHVDPTTAAQFAAAHEGTILDPRTAEALGIRLNPGQVPVMTPSRFNARDVLNLEDMIDAKLKMGSVQGGIDDPIWRNINRAVKSVRDQFGAPRPAPPTPGEPFSPASDQTPPAGPIAGLPTKPVGKPAAAPGQPAADLQGIGGPVPAQPAPAPQPAGSADRPLETGVEMHPSLDLTESVPPSSRPSTPTEAPAPGNPFRRNLPLALQDTEPPAPPPSKIMEPTPSQYAAGELPPEPDWKQAKRGQQSLVDKIDYGRNVEAQKREAKRLAGLSRDEFSYANTPPPASGPSPDEVVSTFQKHVGQDGLVDVPAAAKELAGRYPLQAVHRAILDASSKEAIELRPEAGFNRLSPDELAHSPKGYQGLPMSRARVLEAAPPAAAPEPVQGATIKPGKAKAAAPELTPKMNQVLDLLGKGGVMDRRALGEQMPNGFEPHYELDELEKMGLVKKLSPSERVNQNGQAPRIDAQYKLADTPDAKALLDKIKARRNQRGAVTFEYKKGPTPAGAPAPAKLAAQPDNPNEAILDDGTKVYGLSAIQRRYHLAQQALEEASKSTGANSREAIHRKVVGFNQSPGNLYQDRALLEQANKLGLAPQLRDVAAASAWPQLHARMSGLGNSNGIIGRALDFGLLRLDPALRAVSNAPANPFTEGDAGLIHQYLIDHGLRSLLNAQGGLPGARFGSQAAEAYKENEDGQNQ